MAIALARIVSAVIGNPVTPWEASIRGRNITDTYYRGSAATNASTAVRFPGRSASYGATVRFRFRSAECLPGSRSQARAGSDRPDAFRPGSGSREAA